MLNHIISNVNHLIRTKPVSPEPAELKALYLNRELLQKALHYKDEAFELGTRKILERIVVKTGDVTFDMTPTQQLLLLAMFKLWYH